MTPLPHKHDWFVCPQGKSKIGKSEKVKWYNPMYWSKNILIQDFRDLIRESNNYSILISPLIHWLFNFNITTDPLKCPHSDSVSTPCKQDSSIQGKHRGKRQRWGVSVKDEGNLAGCLTDAMGSSHYHTLDQPLFGTTADQNNTCNGNQEMLFRSTCAHWLHLSHINRMRSACCHVYHPC